MALVLPLSHQQAGFIYHELENILKTGAGKEEQLSTVIFDLFQKMFEWATEGQGLIFNTLFSRMVFVGQRYGVPADLMSLAHEYRISVKTDSETKSRHRKGAYIISCITMHLSGVNIPTQLHDIRENVFTPTKRTSGDFTFKSYIRVELLTVDERQSIAKCISEENPEAETDLIFSDARDFEMVRRWHKQFGLPLTIMLINVEVEEGRYKSGGLVIMPDYLLDITSVSELFADNVKEPALHIIKKFLPFESSVSLMLGNIANYILDTLLVEPDITYKDLVPRIFKHNPLGFAALGDDEVRHIITTAGQHYKRLKKVVSGEFQKLGFNKESGFIEPSFYAPEYGLQGRLDLLYFLDNPPNSAAIIELKSGKPYNPNHYGLNPNHYIQTLLYDLLLKAAFNGKIKPQGYILYSSVDDKNLYFAPVIGALQSEALQLRNEIIFIEKILSGLGDQTHARDNLLEYLDPRRYPAIKGYHYRDMGRFSEAYQSLSTVEKKYFTAFSGFSSREHFIAKTGSIDSEQVSGQATLWLSDHTEKNDRFDLLSYLTIAENKTNEPDAVLTLDRTEKTNPMANFRIGDIVVLYPLKGDEGAPSDQIFKSTLIDITPDKVHIRLRSPQFNDNIFRKYRYWNIEHDILDSSFNAMYKGLFSFAESRQPYKDLLLTLRPPVQPQYGPWEEIRELTGEQNVVLQKMIACEDYHLLWGPPGTGKTSVMIKNLVRHLVDHSSEHILVMAYTNRAVDEICEAIEDIGEAMKGRYLRIGSKYATDKKYLSRLLDHNLQDIDSRRQLIEVFGKYRIFVGTIASVSGKSELLKLKKFDRAIVDEASQILEPGLIGLLPSFRKFNLIGDHLQLPAIVVQDSCLSEITDPELRDIGLTNMRNSLFERLYKRCLQNEWNWAVDILSRQGRMHKDIMDFPARKFYGGKLDIMPETASVFLRQTTTLEAGENIDPIHRIFFRRAVFLPSQAEPESGKTNVSEAAIIIGLIRSFREFYGSEKKSLGIITPYRAQIANIYHYLYAEGIDVSDITIDTVERYQGGARDIILISLCTNTPYQMKSLVNLSDEGIDRKLNVAITRARDHVVLIGNREILATNPIYKEFTDLYSEDYTLPPG